MTTRRGVRFGLRRAAGQVRYQLLLLFRSPIGTFTALVIPLMILVALQVATPDSPVYAALGIGQAEFLAVGMVTFALLNACYVNMITSVVLAREEGVLKRLRGTPLPLFAYGIGRLVAVAVVGIASAVVVLVVSVLFMDVRLTGNQIAGLAGVVGLGIVLFAVLGLAVSTVVPRAEAALPVAYGTLLPIAFISDVFFPSTAAPGWLRHTADVLPFAPIAKAGANAVASSAALPMTVGQLTVTLSWIAGGLLLTGLGFRWEPGTALLRLRLRRA